MEWGMDRWKFYDITHRHHVVCNPMSAGKLDAVIALLNLKRGARVVDIACGKGEMLVRLAERYGISGVGVDISPFCVADSKRKLRQRAPDADVEFLQMDGADYRPGSSGFFDLAMCIGASWVFGGHKGTLRALKAMTAPGGMVLVGEPFWLKEPEDEYLIAGELTRETCASHHANVVVGERGRARPPVLGGQQPGRLGQVRDSPVARRGRVRVGQSGRPRRPRASRSRGP